ncbi:hypothetical protein [Acetivibrio cellulolyticus]|uniref:hypothetical protein n=1 Tax=Acetivibrio cellulolyticus TaxID=35830 RepID=UPI0001E3016E|nr:hypothetical protein [Acetivibrio cellulolyticus]
MPDKIFIEENKFFKIDCNKAMEIVELHDSYNKFSLLSDVDLIILTDSNVIFMEYKNSTIPNANNPRAFEEKIFKDEEHIKYAKKYYESLVYVSNKIGNSNKSREYYFVVECAKADTVVRKMLAGKIKRKLPFSLQENLKDLSQNLIDHFEVLNMEEWNNKFPDYKFEVCATES